MAAGDEPRVVEVTAEGHETRPPARYTEPSLVAKLEELEIGRPSTYASIIRTITARDYVFKKGSALVPTWLAFAVTRLLEQHFSHLIDYSFTAEMEDVLDSIAAGQAERVAVLKDFYYGSDSREGLEKLVNELGDIDARALSTFVPVGGEDSGIEVRVGRYGTYIEDADGRRANVDESLPPDELTVEVARGLLDQPANTEIELGVAPDTGREIVAKDGRFGPYVTEVHPRVAQVGQANRVTVQTMSLDTVTLEDALRLLSLPSGRRDRRRRGDGRTGATGPT